MKMTERIKRGVLAARLVGVLLVLLGAVLAGGGAYLAYLGGSIFYLPAGIAMAGVGVGLVRQRAWAVPVALVLLILSAGWSWAEAGSDFWQWVPRIITFLTVAAIAVLLAPWLQRRDGTPALQTGATRMVGGVLVVAIVGMFVGMFRIHPQVVATGEPAQVLRDEAGSENGDDWPEWGRTTGGNRFAQFDQINRENVGDLEVAWTFRTGDLAIDGAEYQVTPLKIDDSVYLCTPLNKVIALDPINGSEKWRFDPELRETDSNRGWKRCRGVAYVDLDAGAQGSDVSLNIAGVADRNQAQACRRRIVSTTNDGRLFTLDAMTGALCEAFGENGYVDLAKGVGTAENQMSGSYYLTSAPLVADGVVMVGGKLNDNLSVGEPSGVVRGFDVETGALLWAFDVSRPDDNTPLPDGENYAPETPNFWGTAAYDPELGLAFFPTGNQTPDFWTGDRHPYSDKFNDSVVAVEIKTGKLRWHFRTANVDQFDYDVASQPILYDRPNADGTTTPLLVQLTKRGQVFVLDRRDGTPVFPIEQRQVSTDAMPGMRVAQTQPYSSIAVGTERLTESDMWGASIFDQLYCRIQFKQMRWEGEWTPLSDQQATLIYPGYYGGFNWGGGALDARTGTLIVNDIRMAQWGRFIRREEADRMGLKPSTEGEYSQQLGTPWGVERSMFVSPLGVPCFKPPFGTMTAIDLTTGQTRWQVPVGSIQDAPVNGITPGVRIPLGMPTMGGPLVTGGGLTFFHGSLDFYVRAFDNHSGEEIWRDRLPVGGQGAPMSYVGRDGRQYVVVVAGGATRTGTNENRGDYVIAYALPQ